MEESLGDCFIAGYMLELLAHGCEPELRQAASTLPNLHGWAFCADGLPNWARDLSDLANAMPCVIDGSFFDERMIALSKVRAATCGVGYVEGHSRKARPWASKVEFALHAGTAEIRLRHKLDALMERTPIHPKASEEAAEALSEPRECMQPETTGAPRGCMVAGTVRAEHIV